jgi:hypothetical protein
VDPSQLQALSDFKASLGAEGLLGAYDNPQHLANQVVSAIDYDVNAKQWRETGRKLAAGGAILRARHVTEKELGTDSKGRTKSRTISNQLVISNEGDSMAERIRVEVEPMNDSAMLRFEKPESFDLTPGSEVGFLMFGQRQNVKVRLDWEDGDEERTFTQTIRVT